MHLNISNKSLNDVVHGSWETKPCSVDWFQLWPKLRNWIFLPPESLFMAGVFRSAHRRIRSSYSKILTRRLWRRHCSPSQSTIISTSLFIRSVVSAANPKSPFDAITLRILRNEIEYQSDYAPPHLVRRLVFFFILIHFLVLLFAICFT